VPGVKGEGAAKGFQRFHKGIRCSGTVSGCDAKHKSLERALPGNLNYKKAVILSLSKDQFSLPFFQPIT
jgi:7-keto-8-aminopelargonate synthetase-like enzyme